MHTLQEQNNLQGKKTLFPLTSSAVYPLVFLWAVGMALALSSDSSWAEQGPLKRPFTVADSLEVSYIVDPARNSSISLRAEQPVGEPIYSPDGRYFLLVTQCGRISSNTLEGTIWLFDRQKVLNYISGKSLTRPLPRKLITMSATSDLAVVYDVRWIEGSNRIAFLGKDGSPYQRLFVLNLETGTVLAITKDGLYVTAYDIRGNTIAYTTLAEQEDATPLSPGLVSVGDKSIVQLLFQYPPPPEGIGEDYLLRCPSSLHIQRAGQDVSIDYRIEGRPLRVFVPVLSLSPDGSSLITAAPVQTIPAQWEQYRPPFEDRRLKAGGSKTLSDRTSFWRPEQYITVNLATGAASPLVDAPLGRDLGYADTPTEAFWFGDNRHVIVTNTYLPIQSSIDQRANWRQDHSVITILDVSTGDVGPALEQKMAPFTSEQHHEVSSIRWDSDRGELTLWYEGSPTIAPDAYGLKSREWIKLESAKKDQGTELFIRQDLNNPPKLWGRESMVGRESVIWDPNPQLEKIELGNASLYHWHDATERPRSGILLLPSHYDSGRRYPLVIQTHGYQSDRFFADGWATTGSGGRALAAKDIVVLQMDESFVKFSTPEEAPIELGAFESVIDHLVADGIVDRSRVGVIGFSRTCFHVRYALTRRPQLFRAASITDGFDPSYVAYTLFAGGSYSVAPQVEAINGGVPYGSNAENWIRNATGFSVDRIQTPLLISVYEPYELLEQWETYSGMRRLNKPVDLLWWWKGGATHILVQPAQRYASQQSAVDWFDFWFNGHEDSDPLKADQYARWKKLRGLEQKRTSTPPSGH